MTTYTVSLEKDNNGDLVLPFDEEMLADLGWEIGDTLLWNDNGDGTYTLTRLEDDPVAGIEEVGC